MSISKTSKLFKFLNYRIRVLTVDNRTFVGKLLGYDKFLNLILQDCEEFRKLRQKKRKKKVVEKTQKRGLGLVIIRGDNVVSMIVEGPSPKNEARVKTLKKDVKQQLPGMSIPGISRGTMGFLPSVPTAQGGLFGPVPTFGGTGVKPQ